MASCSQCTHKDICKVFVEALSNHLRPFSSWVEALNGTYREGTGCDHFSDNTRVVELPCNIGDLIYEPVKGQISIFKVVSFSVENGALQLHLSCQSGYLTRHSVDAKFLGTTVFLSRPEAEQLLGKGESYG